MSDRPADDDPDPAAPDSIARPDEALLVRVVTGRATAAETRAVQRWAARDPAHRADLESLRELWTAAGISFADTPYDVATEWARIATTMRTSAGPRSTARQPWHGRFATRSNTIAAIILVAVTGVGIAVRTGLQRGGTPAPAREYATAAGQRLTVTLADGTRFILAPASRVHIPRDYGRSVRNVDLTGEGYFAVAHDPVHPFAVHTRGAVARDIGTAFNVRAYAEDAQARIAVAEGVVAVAAPSETVHGQTVHGQTAHGQTVMVRAGDVATVTAKRVTVDHAIDVASLTGWTRGEFAFHDTPLRDVLHDIVRWYGIDVRLTDPTLGDRPVRGTYTTETPQAVLTAVTHAVGAHYVAHAHAFDVVADTGTP